MKNKMICGLGLLFLIHVFSAYSQEKQSKNGWVLTPHGTIRVLVIFVQVDYNLQPDKQTYEAWPKNELPDNADALFDPYWEKPPKGQMTRFFAESSFDGYKVLGDYIDSVITIDEEQLNGKSSYTLIKAVCKKINKAGVLRTKHGLKPWDFDAWTDNNKVGTPRLNQPDSSFDHVMFILRNFHGIKMGTGFASQGSITPILGYGSGTYSCFAGSEFQIMRHEYSHLLFGGNNFHCCGGQHNAGGYNYFIPIQVGWGCMGNYNSMFLTCSGWDRDRMAWKPEQNQYTISAIDPVTGKEKPADLMAAPGQETKKFVLRDFATTGDAIRIQLPYLPQNEFPQWIWLENHQASGNNGSEFDQFQFVDAPCKPEALPGLYAYVQVAKHEKTGRHIFGGFGDYMRMIPANGFYDEFRESKQVKNRCVNGDYTHAFYRKPAFMNPLTGTSDLEYTVRDRWGRNQDAPPDGKIVREESEIKWVEKREGEYISQLTHMGLPEHAFTIGGVNRINMGTNPSTSNMVTLVSLDRDKYDQKKPNNRKVYLNGLDIKIEEEFEDGSLLIAIGFDHVSISEDRRWCGDTIVLPQIRDDGVSLKLEKKTTLRLDRGLTPTRVDEPGTFNGNRLFTSPTVMVIDTLVRMEMEKKSELKIQNGSTLIIQKGAVLDMRKKARVVLDPDARLIVEEGGVILKHRRAKIKARQDQVIGYNLDD